MKLLKVHTTNKGVKYRIEIHAYNLVMYGSSGMGIPRGMLREFRGTLEFRGTTLVTKNDFT